MHYNWHWFWHWGTGELGNNGIHSLDVCRWGLGVDYPRRVTAGGGKYFFDDDQETPDTHMVTYDFGDKAITWEGRNWQQRGFEDSTFGIAFYGDRGSIVCDGKSYKVYDAADKEIASQTKGFAGHDPHLKNFLECVRTGDRPQADIEEGHKSTLLCHAGQHRLSHRPDRESGSRNRPAQKRSGGRGALEPRIPQRLGTESVARGAATGDASLNPRANECPRCVLSCRWPKTRADDWPRACYLSRRREPISESSQRHLQAVGYPAEPGHPAGYPQEPDARAPFSKGLWAPGFFHYRPRTKGVFSMSLSDERNDNELSEILNADRHASDE